MPLLECARCRILAHAAEGAGCPECDRPMARGLQDVGFGDMRRLYGEPHAPWAPPPDEPAPKLNKLGRPKKAELRCDDGHRVRSKPERVIDDWLHAAGILHEWEPRLKGMRPDWRVGDVYVEYWGMKDQQGYEARRAEKLALYEARGLKLVEIVPDDLENLEAKLGFLRRSAYGLDVFSLEVTQGSPRVGGAPRGGRGAGEEVTSPATESQDATESRTAGARSKKRRATEC